jgi:ribosome biogenesis GTPase
MSENKMAALGLMERFSALAAEYPTLSVGRVLLQEKGVYRVVYAYGELSATVSGKFRYEAKIASDYPAVGDFVMFDPNENGGQAVIHHVLSRKSIFIRKASGTSNTEQVVAANVDIVFICMSLNNDFNLRRLERYLSIAWDSGATPVIVLTKADLCDDIADKRSAAESVAVGADIIMISSLEEGGYEAILSYIKTGQTIALIGSSGVGKSTLVNCLLGENRLDTNGLRNDDKGRHTTTHRELFLLPQGGMVIDTPGMRELGMWDAAEGLERTFADIEALALSCRYPKY